MTGIHLSLSVVCVCAGKLLGNGSFGVVIEATAMDTGDTVAIKKVLQDPRYKNRELDIMKVRYHE